MSDTQMDRHMVHQTSASGSAIVYRGLVGVIFIFSVFGIAIGRLVGRDGKTNSDGSIWNEARASAHAAAGYAVKY